MDVDLSDVAVDIGTKEGKFRFHGIARRSAYWMEAKRTLFEFAGHDRATSHINGGNCYS